MKAGPPYQGQRLGSEPPFHTHIATSQTVSSVPVVFVGSGNLISNEYLTPAEVAAILKVSTSTVTRKFERRAGVLNLGSESRFKRKYRTLRIPREALEKFILETRVR